MHLWGWHWATDGRSLFLFQVLCTTCVTVNNPISFACEAPALVGTFSKVASSSEDFQLRWVSIRGNKKFAVWSGVWKIKTPFSLHCTVALNSHSKSLPKRFASEESETRKAWWMLRGPKGIGMAWDVDNEMGWPETESLNRIRGDRDPSSKQRVKSNQCQF